MTAVFADTFYWIALTNPADTAYDKVFAVESRLADATIITTDEVLCEFLTFFAGHSWLRARAAETVQLLTDDPSIRVVPQSRSSFLSGLELYRARPDKGYSLTDCISMKTMWVENVVDALTNDRHFEQEGFGPLFRYLE